MDNDSTDFQLINPEKSRLRSWLQKEDYAWDQSNHGVKFNTMPWAREPIIFLRRWIRSYQPYAYGDIQRSFYFTHANNEKAFAEWKVQFDEPGEYEVFVYCVKNESRRIESVHGNNRVMRLEPAMQYYTLYVGEQKHDCSLFFSSSTKGWESLGRFHFPAGQSKLVLHAKGEYEGQIIYADAVKWVKIEK